MGNRDDIDTRKANIESTHARVRHITAVRVELLCLNLHPPCPSVPWGSRGAALAKERPAREAPATTTMHAAVPRN